MKKTYLDRVLQIYLKPYNLSLLLSIMALIACLIAIYILNNPVAENLDIQRSFPPDIYVAQIFNFARTATLVTASFMAILLSLVLCFVIYAYLKNLKIFNRINSLIYNAYNNDYGLTKLIYTISIVWLGSSIILPYFSYLLMSPWPLITERPWISSADKRWLIVLYNYIWLILLLVTPLLYALFESFYNGKKDCSEEKVVNIFFRGNYSNFQTAASILLGVSIAFVVYGPPWNISDLIRPINGHLMGSMSSYQAIEAGTIPYIGPASFGYGPGTQLFIYYYQHLTGGLDVNSLREAYAFLNFFAATILFTFVLFVFRKIYSVPIVIFLILLSPLVFYQFNNQGELNGFFGWANAVRYLALPIVTLSTVRVLTISNKLLHIDKKGVAIGLTWGFFAYLSQENGVLTFLAVVTILSAAYSGKMVSFQRSLWLLLSILLGAAIFFAPILAFYFYNDVGFEFISNYRLMPGYAFNGITGLYWRLNTYNNYFILMPIIALLIGASSFFHIRPFGIVGKTTVNRLFVLSVAMVVLLAHMSSIIRTADSQTLNSTIGAPFLFALMLVAPITQIRVGGLMRMLAFIFSLTFLYVVIPSKRYPDNVFDKLVTSRYKAFTKHDSTPKQDSKNNLVDSRLPETVRNLKECCHRPTGISGSELHNLINQLKNTIGNRRTHIESLPGFKRPGFVLFLAGINPADTYRDMNTRYPTHNSRIKYTDSILSEISDVEVIVTTDLNRILPKKFISQNADSIVVKYTLKGRDYYVISR